LLARAGAPLLGLLGVERRQDREGLSHGRLSGWCRSFLEERTRVLIVEHEEIFITDEGAGVAAILERVTFRPGWVRAGRTTTGARGVM